MQINKAEILENYNYFAINLIKGEQLPIVQQDSKVTIVWKNNVKVVIPNKYVRLIEENIKLKYKHNDIVTDGINIYKIKSSYIKENKIYYVFYESTHTVCEDDLQLNLDEETNIFFKQFLKHKPANLDINKCRDFIYWLNTEEGNNYLKQCGYDQNL